MVRGAARAKGKRSLPLWRAGRLQLAGFSREWLYRFHGVPTIGLVLNAPCEGITTDNLIGQLDARRQDINEQIDSLEDAVRTSGLTAEAIASRLPRPDSRNLRLIRSARSSASRYQQLSGELAAIEGCHRGYAGAGRVPWHHPDSADAG